MDMAVAVIIATFCGPIAAVQAQKWIERATQRRDAQRSIFRSLMATRATRLAPEHVQALNRIDLEFSQTGWLTQLGWRGQGPRSRDVINRWRIYADHLNSLAENHTQAQLDAWLERGDDLFTDLLVALAAALGYTFDRVQLRRGIYHPRGHSETELRQELIQRAFADILIGARSFPMRITEFPVSQEALDLQAATQQAILSTIQDGTLKVRNE